MFSSREADDTAPLLTSQPRGSSFPAKKWRAGGRMRLVLAAAAALMVAAGGTHAETFRWANDYDVRSLDPYAGQEIFLRSFDENIYEPLVRRGRALALEPALAASWKQTAPDIWRFSLRRGVMWQDGSPFTADDVAFSFARALASGSRVAGRLAPLR